MVLPKRNGLIAALDIGTSKVACMIAYLNSLGNIEVVGVDYQLSQGIKAGVITDVKLAEKSILATLNTAEKMAEENIERVIVSMSSSKISSKVATGSMIITGNQVTDKDINRVVTTAVNTILTPDQEVIHCFPLEYSIDGVSGIKDPRAMYGSELKSELHVVTLPSTAIVNLANCLARCQLDLDNFIISTYASALSCLTDEEKEQGVILFDMGASNTSFATYYDGKLIFADSVPVGGMHITSDIAYGLSINFTTAERIKTLYGNAIITLSDRTSNIDLNNLFDEGQEVEGRAVNRALLGEIISARVEEIYELTRTKLNKAGIDKYLVKRLVLTGGASQLMGLKEFTENYFEKQVRIGYPDLLEGLSAEYRNPTFSSVIGILKFIASDQAKNKYSPNNNTSNKTSIFSKLYKWFNEHF
jgi:cell division protein FtsA